MYQAAKVVLNQGIVKDFGIISVENGFQIYIGGNGGTEVEKAEFLTTVETEGMK